MVSSQLPQSLRVVFRSIFADIGLDEMELGILSGDIDLLPEDVLSSIAARLGFSESFERAIESVFG